MRLLPRGLLGVEERHAHEVLAPARGQRLEVGRRGHARVTDKQTARELPVPQFALDLCDRGDVHRVAGKHPVPHGEAFARERHADDDLRRIATPVLGQPALARRAVGLGPSGLAAVHEILGPDTLMVLLCYKNKGIIRTSSSKR